MERRLLGFMPPDRSEERERVKASIEKGLTETEFAEQRSSFIYGNAPSRLIGITRASAQRAAAYARFTTDDELGRVVQGRQMLASVRARLTSWIVDLFISAISAIQNPKRKVEVLNWLSASRETVSAQVPFATKFVSLYRSLDARSVVTTAFSGVVSAVKRYAKSDLPIAAKVAVPVTLLAMPLLAGQGAGIAAFGSAIGVPVLLLIFIGTAGITAIIEACTTHEAARAYTAFMLRRIAEDEAFRAFRAAMRRGDQCAPEAPVRSPMPEDQALRRAMLLAMDPVEFERHVMSFFEGPDTEDVSITRQTGDKGIDGFAKHSNGLIVVQCKRNASANPVGGPAVRDFSGAMLFHQAWRGYLVTTSGFTRDAKEIAHARGNLLLVDMNDLVRWPECPPSFTIE